MDIYRGNVNLNESEIKSPADAASAGAAASATGSTSGTQALKTSRNSRADNLDHLYSFMQRINLGFSCRGDRGKVTRESICHFTKHKDKAMTSKWLDRPPTLNSVELREVRTQTRSLSAFIQVV